MSCPPRSSTSSTWRKTGEWPHSEREPMRSSRMNSDQPLETAVEAEAPTFGEAVNDAAVRLGVKSEDLAIEILDPGRSSESSGGFRQVKIRARRRAPEAPPD